MVTTTLANVVVGLVAALHVYIMVLEIFLWTTPRAMNVFRTEPAFAKASTAMAANQGLYNGFLAAGLIWGLFAGGGTGFAVKVFFLTCVLVAGVFAAITVNRRVIFIQSVPALLGIVLVFAAR